MRHRQRERLRQRADGADAAILAILLREEVFLRGWKQRPLLPLSV